MTQRIFDKLQAKQPNRNVVFIAIEELETDEEIQQFFKEYLQEVPEHAASNVGYILGYYDTKARKRWMNLLPDVYHPFFGRQVEVSPEEAFEKGREWGESVKERDANV